MGYGALARLVEISMGVSKRTVYRWIKGGMSMDELRGRVKELYGKKLYKASEVAAALNISRSSIYRLYHEGKINGVRLFGNTIRFHKEDVEKAIKEEYGGESRP